MKNKIINLFGDKTVIPNEDVKYSQLLEQFLEPFANEFMDVEYYDEIFEFGINAWNLGIIKSILPDNGDDDAIKSLKEKDETINVDLLKRMMDAKNLKFKNFTNFIVDYEIEETGSDPVLTVVTQEKDAYMADMFAKIEAEVSDDELEFEENYINRTAIILKPLQPFLDWISTCYPKEIEQMKEINTYLIDEDVENVEAWLRKKFDKLFIIELEAWNDNKKEWPQKRNYKMFKQWFQIDISSLVYDLERKPVFKS